MKNNRLLERKIDENLNVEINFAFPKGLNLIKPVNEISDKGLSFYLDEEEGFFHKGTILKNIKIFNNEYETIIDDSEVIYSELMEIDDKNKYKIGLMFLSETNISKKREKRFSSKVLNTVKSRISFFIDGEEHRAQLLDFSKNGISLLIKSPRFIVKRSDIIKDITIIINNEELYKGAGLIVDLDQKNDNLILRISLKNGNIYTDYIFKEGNKNKVDSAIDNLKANIEVKNIVSEEFKKNIHETHNLLINIKNTLDNFEKEIKDYDKNTKNLLIEEMFEKINKEIFPVLEVCVTEIDNILKKINKKNLDIYKIYFQNIMHPLFMLAPILNRIYLKPLGIAGDYEMINMLYKNDYVGDSLFGKMLHKYICSKQTSEVIRTRVDFICEIISNLISERINEKTSEKVKITSVASGSAIEIQKLISYEKNINYLDITLLDFLEEAIAHSKNKINLLENKYNRKSKIKFVKESIFNIIKDKKALDKIEDGQDIIYSLGLFEYLTDSTCKILLKVLSQKLSKNGVLIIGNYINEAPLKGWMELGVDWYLIYRDEQKVLNLSDKLNYEKILKKEKTGFFNFLILKKQ